MAGLTRNVPKRNIPRVGGTTVEITVVPAPALIKKDIILPKVEQPIKPSEIAIVETRSIKLMNTHTELENASEVIPVSLTPTPDVGVTTFTNGMEYLKTAYHGQLTLEDFSFLSMTAQNALWSELQKQAPEFGFVPCILYEKRAKNVTKRLAEAKEEGTAGVPMGQQLWCPFCGKWRTFRNSNGYDKCIGCGVSTAEYATRCDNHLFGGTDTKTKQAVKALSVRKAKIAEGEENE